MSVPELKYGDGSWMVVEHATDEVVLEIFLKSTAEKINQIKYKLIPAGEYLAGLNQ